MSEQRTRRQQILSRLLQVNVAVFLYLCLVPINMLFVSAGERFPFDGLSLVAIVPLIFGYGAFSVYNLAVLMQRKPTRDTVAG